MADNNNNPQSQGPNANAGADQASRPRPVPQQQDKPKPPEPNAIAKVRDVLHRHFRITGFESFTRGTARAILLNQQVLGRLVNLFADVFHSMWNSGFSQIDPVAAVSVAAQCQLLARNYIHSWMIDLYSSVRLAVQKKSPAIFLAHFAQDIGFTGLKFDPFLTQLAAMLHPVQCNSSLEETLYTWRFDLDQARQHNNWFNIPNVAVNDLSIRRQNAIVDTLIRSKQVSMSAPKTGTTTGSGSTLLDFYPRNPNAEPVYGLSWLNLTDNFSDTDLAIMFIIARDFHANRLGPRFVFESFHEAVRNAAVAPYPAANIEEEDTYEDNAVRGFHVDADGNEVADYRDARGQDAEVATLYFRTFWFYRKMHLVDIDATMRQSSLMMIVKSGV